MFQRYKQLLFFNANFDWTIQNLNFQGKAPPPLLFFFRVTKQQLNNDKLKHRTYPVMVCGMPGVSGGMLAWQTSVIVTVGQATWLPSVLKTLQQCGFFFWNPSLTFTSESESAVEFSQYDIFRSSWPFVTKRLSSCPNFVQMISSKALNLS